jgi:Domain of unknown function (DUF4082)/PEP-CTERM motif
LKIKQELDRETSTEILLGVTAPCRQQNKTTTNKKGKPMKTRTTIRSISLLLLTSQILLTHLSLGATPALTPVLGPGIIFEPEVNTSTIGWQFTVNSPVSVSALGFFDVGLDGLAQSHQVGIWANTGTLLVSGTVSAGTSSTLDGSFRYVTVPGTILTPGTYRIGAFYVANSADLKPGNSESITTDPAISYIQPNYGLGSFTFPNVLQGIGNGLNHFGPNFELSPVPEPSTLVLLSVGGIVVMVRSLRGRRVT